ncbi:hypothetical protein ALP46_200111 [Pseudomonas amygdali pv. myricae]|nr:hypothetical protein ALP46_200111 [Pseudomonas amygdali pv. myricae]
MLLKTWTNFFCRLLLGKQRRLRWPNGELVAIPESCAHTTRVVYEHFSDAGGDQSLLELLPSGLRPPLLNPRHTKYILGSPISLRNFPDIAYLQHCVLDVPLSQEQTKPGQKIVIQSNRPGGKGIVQCHLRGRALNFSKRSFERVHRQDCSALAVPFEANTFQKVHGRFRHAKDAQTLPFLEKGAQGSQLPLGFLC